MSRIKSKFAFSKPMRRGRLPRSVWPRPDRAVSPQEKREASSRRKGATGIAHRADGSGGLLDVCGRRRLGLVAHVVMHVAVPVVIAALTW